MTRQRPIERRFALLAPRKLPPRPVTVLKPGEPWGWVLNERRSPSEPLALDFETRGRPTDDPKSSYPVGVGLSDSRGSIYIPFNEPQNGKQCPTYWALMHELSRREVPLLAHNVPFDGAWPLRDFGLWMRWVCTLAAYKMTATEGHFDQLWGLKEAQVELLGWTETNETELDTWLVNHGYVASLFKEPGPGRYPVRGVSAEEKLSHPDNRWATPRKEEMWRAPSDILGRYCALDADATWQLWTHILSPVVNEYRVLREYIHGWYPPYMRKLAEAMLRGIQVDVLALGEGQVVEALEAGKLAAQILESPSVESHNIAWGELLAAEVRTKEPPQFKKDGTESKNWLNWAHRVDAAYATNLNLNSDAQLRWLLFERMGFPVGDRTETGLPKVDEGALKQCGEVGAELLKLADKHKLVSFYRSTLSQQRGGVIRPSFRVPGTVTGRLSSKEPNVQQQPNDARYLSCWRARPGFKIVACDVTSLENYVLAELSRDPTLMKLYGPDARPGQDAYLFNAANLPVIGPKIRATGYNPDTATAEETARTKKLCKTERTVGKFFTLMSNYKAGPAKIQKTMAVQAGLKLPMGQVEEMYQGFWDLYGGILEYERALLRQLDRNGGWILNGVGRPMGICRDKRKDVVNTVCQSTGHDLYVRLLLFQCQLLDEAGIEWYPWIPDLHDAGYFEVREDLAEAALDLVSNKAYTLLNEWGGQLIPLRGEGKVLNNWGEAVEA